MLFKVSFKTTNRQRKSAHSFCLILKNAQLLIYTNNSTVFTFKELQFLRWHIIALNASVLRHEMFAFGSKLQCLFQGCFGPFVHINKTSAKYDLR